MVDFFIDIPEDINEDFQDDLARLQPAMEALTTLCMGFESATIQELTDPAGIDGIGQNLTIISEVTGMDIPVNEITGALVKYREEPQPIATVVSTEGIGKIIKDAIANILEWLAKVRDWFKNLFKSSNVQAKVAKATAETAAKVAQVKVTKIQKEQGAEASTIKRVGAPLNLLMLLHHSRQTPRTDYTYNLDDISKAYTSISVDMRFLTKAVEREVDVLLPLIDELIDYVLKDQPIPTALMLKVRNSRGLSGLVHNGWESIGFKLIERPMRNANEFRPVKYSLTNVAGEHGWTNGGQTNFQLDVDLSRLDVISKIVDSGFNEVHREHAKVMDKLIGSKALKRLEDIRDLNKILETDNLDDAHRANVQKRINILYELTSQLTNLCQQMVAAHIRYLNTISYMVKSISETA